MTECAHPAPPPLTLLSPPLTLSSLRTLPPVISLMTAAPFHRISRPQAYRLLASGGLPFPVHKVGERWRVRTAELAMSLGVDPSLLLEPLELAQD